MCRHNNATKTETTIAFILVILLVCSPLNIFFDFASETDTGLDHGNHFYTHETSGFDVYAWYASN